MTRRWLWRTLAAAAIPMALGAAGCAKTEAPMTPGEKAQHELFVRYGGPEFYQVQRIAFTFNVGHGDTATMSRSWTWSPPDGKVTLTQVVSPGDTTRVMYNHKTVTPQDSDLAVTDQKFINDIYWLLYPLEATWDTSAVVTDDGIQPLPYGNETAHRLTVQHGHVGYTPGDMFRLYLDHKGYIRAWSYFPGGDTTNGHPMIWAPPTKVGPLLIQLNHHSPNDSFRLWFTNVAVTVKGRREPYKAG